MKKKLEAELMSLAHQTLQLKNKSDIAVLHQHAQKLYEKLSVLRFVEENFADVKPTIGQAEVEEKLEKSFDYDEKVVVGSIEEEPTSEDSTKEEMTQQAEESQPKADPEHEVAEQAKDDASEKEEKAEKEADKKESEDDPKPAAEPEIEEEPKPEPKIEEPKEEETAPIKAESEAEKPEETQTDKDIIQAESPTFEAAIEHIQPEAIQEIAAAKPEAVPDLANDELFKPAFELSFEAKKEDAPAPQFTFDDLLGKDYADPVFVKPEENQKPVEPVAETPKPQTDIWQRRPFETSSEESSKPASLNDKLSKGITIGLNDRVAFMKNLFNNSSEDYNRVLSQLMTFDTFGEARDFIEQMVKPDYNDWNGKEEYEQRFMEIVEKRFS